MKEIDEEQIDFLDLKMDIFPYWGYIIERVDYARLAKVDSKQFGPVKHLGLVQDALVLFERPFNYVDLTHWGNDENRKKNCNKSTFSIGNKFFS